MPDPTMATALFVGQQLSGVVALPGSLAEPGQRAHLVHEVDPPLDWQTPGRIRAIGPALERLLPDVSDAMERASIALRLWAGCLAAAKTIALETRDGPNSPELRTAAFAQIDGIAEADPIYGAGVEAAPAFKVLRGQSYSFDGVPSGSRVRWRTPERGGNA